MMRDVPDMLASWLTTGRFGVPPILPSIHSNAGCDQDCRLRRTSVANHDNSEII
jgi:hypothetical protein